MKKILSVILLLVFISCGRKVTEPDEKIITVSIGPFKYFVEAIAGNEYAVNVMVIQICGNGFLTNNGFCVTKNVFFIKLFKFFIENYTCSKKI